MLWVNNSIDGTYQSRAYRIEWNGPYGPRETAFQSNLALGTNLSPTLIYYNQSELNRAGPRVYTLDDKSTTGWFYNGLNVPSGWYPRRPVSCTDADNGTHYLVEQYTDETTTFSGTSTHEGWLVSVNRETGARTNILKIWDNSGTIQSEAYGYGEKQCIDIAFSPPNTVAVLWISRTSGTTPIKTFLTVYSPENGNLELFIESSNTTRGGWTNVVSGSLMSNSPALTIKDDDKDIIIAYGGGLVSNPTVYCDITLCVVDTSVTKKYYDDLVSNRWGYVLGRYTYHVSISIP